MATHSSILVWEIPWTEGLGGLQSVEPQRVRHDRHNLEHTGNHWKILFRELTLLGRESVHSMESEL